MDSTYRAIAELGRATNTIILARYLRRQALRREIHEGLKTIEQWNSANNFVYFARRGEMASNRRENHEISMLSLHLQQDCMVYVNMWVSDRGRTRAKRSRPPAGVRTTARRGAQTREVGLGGADRAARRRARTSIGGYGSTPPVNRYGTQRSAARPAATRSNGSLTADLDQDTVGPEVPGRRGWPLAPERLCVPKTRKHRGVDACGHAPQTPRATVPEAADTHLESTTHAGVAGSAGPRCLRPELLSFPGRDAGRDPGAPPPTRRLPAHLPSTAGQTR
jgi:hypothetical protein